MLLKTIICTLALVFLGCSTWTKGDTIRHSTYTTLWAIDYLQTTRIADQPEKYKELNPFLGEHPSKQDVTIWFGATYTAYTAIAIVLPSPYREWWHYSGITVEAVCVGNNYRIGLGFGF